MNPFDPIIPGLDLTFPEDLHSAENQARLLHFCISIVPDEEWHIIHNRDCRFRAECDSLAIEISTTAEPA